MGKQVDRENVPDNLSHHHFIICDVSLQWNFLQLLSTVFICLVAKDFIYVYINTLTSPREKWSMLI